MDILLIFITQIIFLILWIIFLFLIFECIPLLFGAKNTIKKNFHDFLIYQLVRGLYTVTVGAIFVFCIFQFNVNKGLVNISHLSHISQAIIIYFFSELVIYLAHMYAHKRKIPIITKAHQFHHTITNDMEWVNSRKEHLIIITLFMLIFTIFCFVVFNSSNISHIFVTTTYLLLNSFSHYRKPITIKYLNQIFLFPGEHIKHHTLYKNGPYGVTLSIFDTIFNTRN